MLVILSVLWGGSFFFVEIAVEHLPPFTIASLRVLLAAAALHLYIRARKLKIPANRQLWTAFLFMGIVNNAIPFSLIAWGQSHIASGLASILNATTPFFTIIAAHFFTKDEKITAERLIGILIGLLGVSLIVGPQLLARLGTNILAQLAILGAAVSYALAGVYGRRFRAMEVDPPVIAAGQVTVSSSILITLALVVDRPWTFAMPGWEVWGAVMGLGLLSTALAYILYFRILAAAGATNLQLVTLLIPANAILLGTTILGERLEPQHYAGMTVLSAGLIIIDGRLFRFLLRWVRDRTGQHLPG